MPATSTRRLPLLAIALTLACGNLVDEDDDTNQGTQTPGATPTPATPTQTPTPDPMAQNQASRSGDYAYDLLKDAPYSRLHIEIDYVEGNPPFQTSVDALIDTLETLCDKPGGVTYDASESDVLPQPTEGGVAKTGYTYGEVNTLEKTWRDHYRAGDEAVLYFLFVNGKYLNADGSETNVIGFAHHGSSMAVFKGTVNQGLPTSSAFYERSVMRHETGHLLGLVTTGIPAVDPSHVDTSEQARGVHCTNDKCLMHWSVGAESFITSALTGQELTFDQDCLDDMAAARAGGAN